MPSRLCEPCRNDSVPLTGDAVTARLSALPEWRLVEGGNAIEREWKFKNFRSAWQFVERVGELAEAEDHHPDIHFGWGYACIRFTTHAIGGLHANDFIMAGLVDKMDI